jgi:hypothetical protein
MARPKKFVVPEISKKYQRVYEVELPNGKSVVAGEIIKIIGEYGATFRFDSFCTNIENGAQWVDCRQIHRGQIGQFRAFRLEQVKKIPVRRKRRVSRNADN